MTNHTTLPRPGSIAVAAGKGAVGLSAAPPGKRAATGSFDEADLSAIVELSRRRPIPQLVLPILGPSRAPQIAVRHVPYGAGGTEHGALPPLAAVPQFASRPPATSEHAASLSLEQAPRESRATDVLGFALAWIMTTAAGALVVGHVMARSQPPVVVRVPYVSHTPDPPESMPADKLSCPKNGWQPPVVAVADLPAAPRSRTSFLYSSASDEAAEAPPSAAVRPARPEAQEAPRRPAAPARKVTAAALRHPRREAPRTSQTALAKTAPKTLEDWMRASVGSH